ncbi:MAG: dihydroorotate dehydrogenase electron transfer subunit [Clostridiales Family XIII bacterium]|jgi:dihydroorotate dehydrogenase electron transfer subunit|nr:dihydroorotate dehydrogenase electron transfer subunit [Clostridiales Family XIII bacterium]
MKLEIKEHKIFSVKNIAENIFAIEILSAELSKTVRPGQFINIYLDNGINLLPRPISICDAYDDKIFLVFNIVGEGTKILSKKKKDMNIKILGPLGNGFQINNLRNKKILLIGGGLGVAPLLFLAKKLKEQKNHINAYLGFSKEKFLIDEFNAFSSNIKTIIGGNILDILKAEEGTDLIFSVGPIPMYRVLAEKFIKRKIPFYISLEERMGCGFGACVGCTIKTVNGNKKICKDGPVFEIKKIPSLFSIKEETCPKKI